jgi:hypothetical protein
LISRPGRLLGTAIVAFAILVACTSSPAGPAPTGSKPAASLAAAWPVELDATAIGLAAVDDGVIAVTPAGTRFPPQIYRFDASGRQVAQQTQVGNPNALAIAPDGTAWVAAVRHPDMASGTGVAVLDPVTLRVRRELNLSAQPFSVAFAGAEAWIGTSRGIEVVDVPTGFSRRTVRTSGPAYGLVAAPARRVVVAVGSSMLESLGVPTGRRLARRTLAATGTIAATLAGGRLWAAWPVDDGSVLGAFDPVTLRQLIAPFRLGAATAAVTGTEFALWAADRAGRRLLCLDPTSGTVRATRTVPNDAALAADERYVYVADHMKVARLPADCSSAG